MTRSPLTMTVIALCLTLAACGGGAKKHSTSSGSTSPSCTGSLAWCAPVGVAVQGAALSDGWGDLREIPAPVNVSGGWTDSVAVTSDGLHLYFGYSLYDFEQFNVGLHQTTPVLNLNPTGTQRSSQQLIDGFKIYRADLSASGWSVTYHPVNDFIPGASQASPSVNEAQNLMVYSIFDDNSDASLNAASFDGSTWSALPALPTAGDGSGDYINAIDPTTPNGCAHSGGDDNGFIIGDIASSVTLYWESHRGLDNGTTCGGNRHIYQSTFDGINHTWSTIIPTPGLQAAAGASDDSQVAFSPDGLTAYWTSVRTYQSILTYDLFTADWDATTSTYLNTRAVVAHTLAPPYTSQLVFHGEINVAEVPEGWVAYFMCAIGQSATDANDAVLKVCRMKKPRVKINTTSGWSDSPFISRDGQRLYFMYSRYNFAPWIHSGGSPSQTSLIVASGPDRPGLHHSATNPFDESDIYVATKKPDGTWTEPVDLGLNGAFGDSSGMEVVNGSNVSFIWLQGNGTTNDIVMATRNTDGTWNAVTSLGSAVNDHTGGAIVDNPYLSSDGTKLYFVSNRSGGVGGKDIWFSAVTAGVGGTPVDLGSPVDTTGDEDQPFINEAGTDAWWNTGGNIMHCSLSGGVCTSPDVVTIPGCSAVDGKFPAEASIPDDGSRIYFACGDLATARITIMYANSAGGGTWGTATPVD